eukprot:PITA_14942
MFPGLNAIFIVLIPKETEPSIPDKYRPITLCNIIYKIVSKIITSRLKLLLPLIISPEQSGYVEGKQITNGIILTTEIIHFLKQSKKLDMLLKIYLYKAFDSLSWVYIRKILTAFGFAPLWVRRVMSLLSSSLFSVLINGTPSPTFRPSRGFRQGDPLSPFPFVIIAEGHPSIQEARQLKALLSDFSEASGANVNKVKSQIFFFNTPVITQTSIARILCFTIAFLPSKYLGAPLTPSALKHSSWKILLEKLEAHLFLWTHKTLNMASRVVLIKVVLHSMPLYLFSILAAPKWVLKEIKKLQHSFLWGSSGPTRKWDLVKWDKVCIPKCAGGIGLRDPSHNNEVMGPKIWWRWLYAPFTLSTSL